MSYCQREKTLIRERSIFPSRIKEKKERLQVVTCSLLKTMQLVLLDFLSDYPMNGLAIRRIRDITRP
jgi:hypothetical protein